MAVKEGDTVPFGGAEARVIDTPGHTRGQINFFFPDGEILLSGDTLFSLGCGRLIEGNAEEMFASLRKLAALPAAPRSAAATNTPRATHGSRSASMAAMPRWWRARRRRQQQRAAGQPTVPSSMADELAANPFLRAPDVASFAKLRAKKDKFRRIAAVKLFFSPTSPYVRKVLACAITRDIDARLDEAGVQPPTQSPPELLSRQSAVEGAVPGDR